MALISFSCLVALASTARVTLGSGAEMGHPCLIPSVGRKVFSLLPSSMMLAIGFCRYSLSNRGSFPLLLLFCEILA